MAKQTAEIDIQLTNGSQAGKTMNQLTSESVKLNREIKKLEIGSDEWVKKTAEYKQINGRLKEVKTEVYATDKAQGLLNSTMGQYIPFNSQIQKFIGTYKGVSGALKTTTLAQKALNVAIAMSGIGAILILLGSLITYLTSTQEGMDAVTRVTRPLFAIFEKLKGLVQELGGSVFKGLAQILKGDLTAGLKTLASGVSEAVTGVAGAIKEGAAAGTEIDKLAKQIERTQNDMIVSQARLNRQIAEQSELARDASKSEKDRQEAAQKAIDLLAQRTKAEDDLLAMQIRKLEIEQSLNDTDREGHAEMNQLIAQREENEAKASRERIRLNAIANKELVAGTESVTKSHESEVDKRIAAEAKYEKMVVEADKKLQDSRIGLISDEQDRKIAEINLAAQREMEAFEGTEAQKTEFLKLKQQERDAAIEAIIEENNIKAREKNLARLEEENLLVEEKINEQFFNKLISGEEREQQIYELQKSAIERRLALLVASGATESLEYQKLYTQLAQLHSEHEAEKTAKSRKEEEARRELQMAGLTAASGIFAGFADLLSQDEEARKKNWKTIKALKTAELLSNLPVEISNIWKNANTFPAPFNIIVGAAQTALAGARFVQAKSQLESVKYSKGGPVQGPSHNAGGVPFGVKGYRVRHEMEGDEIILSKGVYRDPVLRTIASDLNVMGGGRSFAMGGPVTDRGFVSTSADSSTARREAERQTAPAMATADMRRSESLLEEIARNTKRSADNPPNISIQKVREGLTTLNDVEREARF